MSNRILIVDDNEYCLRPLSRLLTAYGYQTCGAANGFQALGLLADFAPCVIILDLNMPLMDGYEFLEARRTLAVPYTHSVLIYTAEFYPDRDRLIQLGAANIYRKVPDDLDALLEDAKRLCALAGNELVPSVPLQKR